VQIVGDDGLGSSSTVMRARAVKGTWSLELGRWDDIQSIKHAFSGIALYYYTPYIPEYPPVGPL